MVLPSSGKFTLDHGARKALTAFEEYTMRIVAEEDVGALYKLGWRFFDDVFVEPRHQDIVQ